MTPRIRFRDKRYVVSAQHKAEQFASVDCYTNPVWSTYYQGTQNVTCGEYSSFVDNVNPGYHSRSAKGEIFFSPMSQATLSIDEGSGTVGGVLKDKTQSCTSGGTMIPHYKQWRMNLLAGTYGRLYAGFTYPIVNGVLVPPAPIIDAREMSAAVTEAATSCLAKRGTSDSNLWETVAELDKSFGMLHDALHEFRKLCDKNLWIPKRYQAMAALYLLYRYGGAPLVSDIEEAIKGVSKAVGLVRRTSRSRVFLSKSAEVVSRSAIGAYASWVGDRRVRTTESVTIRAMSLDEVEASLGFNLGFNTKSLLTLPWELKSNSFVLDWFINIGDYLNAIAPTFNARQLGSCLVLQREIASVSSGENFRSSYSTMDLTAPPDVGPCSAVWRIVTRTVPLPVSGIVIKQDFRLTNLKRCLDALALITQRLPRFIHMVQTIR